MNLNLLHATHYFNLGLNVTCISNELNFHNFYCKNILKNPNHDWKQYFNTRQSESDLQSLNWNKSTGVGTVTGFGGLIAIDIDGCTDYLLLNEIIRSLGLPLNYEWVSKTGSNNGFQILCYGEKLEYIEKDVNASTYPANEKNLNHFEKIEFLWKTHLVLPPSLHNSGNQYQFINCRIPKEKPQKINKKGIEDLIKNYLNSNLEKHGVDYGYYDEIKQEYFPNIIFKDEYHPIKNINIDYEKHDPEIRDAHCILDIETDELIRGTQAAPIYPSVLQIAWILMNNDGTILKRTSTLIKSNLNQNTAHNINKINIDIANNIGIPIEEALRLLSIDLKKSCTVIAHNIDFDISILNYYFSCYGIDNPIAILRKYCTMKDAQPYFKKHFCLDKYPKLEEMYHLLFRSKASNLHNAENDVLITAKCYRFLLKEKITIN
jgi:DNA polymerase III epsilon subunit-like protein